MVTSDFQDLHWLLDIIQSTDVGIVVLDKGFDIEIFNRFMQVHSGISPEDAIGANVFDLFPYLEDEWFKRRVNTVFELGIPVYTTWEQRDNVFDFDLKLPIHYETRTMFQNTTFVPLHSATDQVEKVGIIVYDVTDSAVNRSKLELAKDELLRLSRTDKLTALWNRGYWEERMNEEFSRSKRSNHPTCLVMFDIDHFKNINDTYGHQVGDDAIRAVSRLMLENSREVDILGRYGGEEFAIVLPDTALDGAMIYCERLREAIANNIVESQGQTVQFTISLGIAVLDEQTRYPTDWLVNSDRALYRSKEHGRNQTNVFGDITPEQA
ncbi:diguanylate cyclase [Oceanicoccus sp. KOV_DT_Chl]|uniref:diguanylate cyclase n=1 Tax=Oceanicoccus sp. KOV_DT_Chl TaxID=1904639 RepID=UPI000C7CA455|nr:diguanylate cyclase [Oceanicoccus sp. KOV_DT_Chl]